MDEVKEAADEAAKFKRAVEAMPGVDLVLALAERVADKYDASEKHRARGGPTVEVVMPENFIYVLAVCIMITSVSGAVDLKDGTPNGLALVALGYLARARKKN